MFNASVGAIKKLARDPRFIGTELPDFTAVLQTWGRQVQYHPNLHFIVPAGGLSPLYALSGVSVPNVFV